MKILAINDGYTSGAGLVIDGRITHMAQEERFNRIKNYGGAPEKTLAWIFRDSGIKPEEIDQIALAWETEPFRDIKSFQYGRHKYYSLLCRFLPRWLMGHELLFRSVLLFSRAKRKRLKLLKPLLRQYRLDKKKIIFVEHHLTHAAASYYASGFKDKYKKSLVITYDGSGDGVCTTVSLAEGRNLTRIFSQTPYDSLAIMYTRVTEFLGMKPLEHEYKLMGLAPYSPDAIRKRAYEQFKKYIRLSRDGLSFVNTSRSWGNSFLHRLEKDMAGIRFDGVAAGLQQIFEELMYQYILNWSKKTGIRNVVAGGGAFMNVKLNMMLAQSRELNDFFVLPSCGDESLMIGAGLYAAENCAGDSVKPISNTYFGNEIPEDEIIRVLKKYRKEVGARKIPDIEKRVAGLLAEGQIVGRAKGKMEWGARALGNRSILAHPGNSGIIKQLNKVVKQRDYWMPFAPSILFEERNNYTINPKKVDSPFMILAFESTERARKEMPAGLHPFDDTCRPQFVRKEVNPDYHRLLTLFKKRTGIGGVLNTSCNIHGYPIICSAEDSVRMLLDSEIDYMAIGNYLCWRKKKK